MSFLLLLVFSQDPEGGYDNGWNPDKEGDSNDNQNDDGIPTHGRSDYIVPKVLTFFQLTKSARPSRLGALP